MKWNSLNRLDDIKCLKHWLNEVLHKTIWLWCALSVSPSSFFLHSRRTERKRYTGANQLPLRSHCLFFIYSLIPIDIQVNWVCLLIVLWLLVVFINWNHFINNLLVKDLYQSFAMSLTSLWICGERRNGKMTAWQKNGKCKKPTDRCNMLTFDDHNMQTITCPTSVFFSVCSDDN